MTKLGINQALNAITKIIRTKTEGTRFQRKWRSNVAATDIWWNQRSPGQANIIHDKPKGSTICLYSKHTPWLLFSSPMTSLEIIFIYMDTGYPTELDTNWNLKNNKTCTIFISQANTLHDDESKRTKWFKYNVKPLLTCDSFTIISINTL